MDNMKKHTVVGIYDDASKARKAEKELLNEGFGRDKVDLSLNDKRDRDKSSSFFGSLFGDNKDDARRHTEIAQDSTVLTVHTQSLREAERAATILDKFGTLDVGDSRRTQAGAETATGKGRDMTSKNSIPVIEEEMEVGKREVTTGGVRLRSRIVERPVEEHMRLREEHINVDRKPVDRKATEADFNNFKEGTIEAKERAEVPVVNKEARVVEEVSMKKDVHERKETIRDTVRKTDVDVEKIKGDEKNPRDRR